MKNIAKCQYCGSCNLVKEELINKETKEKRDSFMCLDCESHLFAEELTIETIDDSKSESQIRILGVMIIELENFIEELKITTNLTEKDYKELKTKLQTIYKQKDRLRRFV